MVGILHRAIIAVRLENYTKQYVVARVLFSQRKTGIDSESQFIFVNAQA